MTTWTRKELVRGVAQRTVRAGRLACGGAALLATGAACLAPSVAGAQTSAAPSSIEVVYSFAGGADGKYPEESLVVHNGVLYGTTFNGGGGGDCGTIFGLTTSGVKTFTHVLTSEEGCAPKSLAAGADGNLYGVNERSGVGSNPAISYQGSAFRISTSGTFNRLHLFDSAGPSFPAAGLVAGRDGSFYGTTSRNAGNANGVVFRLTPQAGNEATVANLYGFSAAQPSKPGAVPATKMIEDATTEGVFYGTTSGAAGVVTAGTLFRITSLGTYQLLRSFGTDGERASGPLAQAADGMLYGTTSGGGANGQGTVFRIATDGTGYQLLHSFNAAADQLSKPRGGLIRGADGNLYGVAGGVFRVTPASGQVARLLSTATVNSTAASLISGNDLEARLSGLVQAPGGSLYAVATYGGSIGCGGEGSVPGAWGCGAVVRIVAAEGTNIGGSNNNGGGNNNGGDGDGDGGGSGGGGYGTTLGVLASLMLGLLLRRRMRLD